MEYLLSRDNEMTVRVSRQLSAHGAVFDMLSLAGRRNPSLAVSSSDYSRTQMFAMVFWLALLCLFQPSLPAHFLVDGLELAARIDSRLVLSRLRGGSGTDGKLYAFGGFAKKDLYTDTVESITLSDKERWHWKRKPYMKTGKACFCTVTLQGKVYLLGGQDSRYFEVQRRVTAMSEKNETVNPQDWSWP
eukprot:756483-Hanusia_phi.AAC.3